MKLSRRNAEALLLIACLGIILPRPGMAQTRTKTYAPAAGFRMLNVSQSDDSLQREADSPSLQKVDTANRSAWGIDVLLSNNGFGLGTFYRREITEDLSGFASLSVSESKDDREVEIYDPYLGISYTPGKLNRFLVVPLIVGVQYRLFREDIMDSFRPYVNAGAGPTMVYSSPYTEITNVPGLGMQANQVDFFKSLGRGQAHYTVGAFVGLGANFGTERSNLFGVNIRYYFTYLLGDGLPSLYNNATGEVAGTKKDFGGFFITFKIGMGY